MTQDIAIVLIVVAVAVVLFVSERLRVDLVALLVLGSLVVTGLVDPPDALSGFSNPAVITVWAVFILSGGLTQTGVAHVIGQTVMRFAGSGELRLVLFIMATAGVLSAFMNNVGVAALLLPVVMEIARKTAIPPSRLLMPLAYGSLLGGLTTLIGTPPNILASDSLRDFGLEPFELFDFAPVGVVLMLAGILFMVFAGRHLLPSRDVARNFRKSDAADLESVYELEKQLHLIRIPPESTLAGMTLADSQLGSRLDLNVVAIVHNGRPNLSPVSTTRLQSGDQLIVIGQPDQLNELRQHNVETLERTDLSLESAHAAGIELVEVDLADHAEIIGQNLAQSDFRQAFQLNVLAIRRGGRLIRKDIHEQVLKAGDQLLVQGLPNRIAALRDDPDFYVSSAEETDVMRLNKRMLMVCVPQSSALVGKSLFESRLGEAYGLTILRIIRGQETLALPDSAEKIRAGDTLIVQGDEDDITAIRGLERLELSQEELEFQDIGVDERVSLAEAVLSPHTTLAGKSLAELHFREKYGLNVLAIWRGGLAFRTDLREIALRFGDALLLHGPREKVRLLAHEPDFLVLSQSLQTPPKLDKAPVAVGIMVGVLLTVMLGWLPIANAAVIGGTLMVLTRCLSMEEAYRFIEWPAVFLIASMLPLGVAMQNSGAARYLADGMLNLIGQSGPLAVLAGLFILSTLASQVMPNPAVVVLMAPIAVASAGDLLVSPHTFMMGIAIAASASFLSPVSHPANVLVMGPGGYRFSDYIRVGLPLTIVVFLITMLLLPLIWPP